MNGAKCRFFGVNGNINMNFNSILVVCQDVIISIATDNFFSNSVQSLTSCSLGSLFI